MASVFPPIVNTGMKVQVFQPSVEPSATFTEEIVVIERVSCNEMEFDYLITFGGDGYHAYFEKPLTGSRMDTLGTFITWKGGPVEIDCQNGTSSWAVDYGIGTNEWTRVLDDYVVNETRTWVQSVTDKGCSIVTPVNYGVPPWHEKFEHVIPNKENGG